MKLIFFWTLFVFPILSSSGLLPLAVNAPSTLERSHVCSVSWLSLTPLSAILINHCHHHLSPSTLGKVHIRMTGSKCTPKLPLTDLSPFPGSLTHLGTSRGLQSQKFCILHKRGPFWAIFWHSLTPPANPLKFSCSKMAYTGVPHIALYVLCPTRTCRGHFRLKSV